VKVNNLKEPPEDTIHAQHVVPFQITQSKGIAEQSLQWLQPPLLTSSFFFFFFFFITDITFSNRKNFKKMMEQSIGGRLRSKLSCEDDTIAWLFLSKPMVAPSHYLVLNDLDSLLHCPGRLFFSLLYQDAMAEIINREELTPTEVFIWAESLGGGNH